MKLAYFFVSFVLCSCGSAAEIAAALRETPEPAETTASAPGIVWTATPLPAIPRKNMVDDYQRIEKGMTQEEIVALMGDPDHEEQKNVCDNGKCKSYLYLRWEYPNGRIGTTIQNGVCIYTYSSEL
jgi:hypothetical protein